MNRFELISQIKKYKAFNEQEEKDKYLLLEWIMDNEDAFSRENKIAHITATGWVVNKDRSKVLMVYHNIYDSWSWVGDMQMEKQIFWQLPCAKSKKRQELKKSVL